MLKELDSYDWEEVFGEGGGWNCTPITPNRWFVARGGCDYSGWGCQASNSGDVASRPANAIFPRLSIESPVCPHPPIPPGCSRPLVNAVCGTR